MCYLKNYVVEERLRTFVKHLFLNLDDGNGNLKANYNLSLGKPNHNWSDLSQVNLHFYLTYGVLMLAQEY